MPTGAEIMPDNMVLNLLEIRHVAVSAYRKRARKPS
jgi:hypothetical protein